MLFAKTKSAQKEFGQMFESKNIFKTYIALSASRPKKKQGVIKGDMGKSRNGSYKLLRTMLNPSVTADRMYLHAYALKFSYQEKEYHFKHFPVEGEFFYKIRIKF